jgi:hypothetical protein
MRFKNEQINDTAVNLCSETPIEIKLSYLQRELQNIKNRYKYINAQWTPDDVRNKPENQNILLEFCSYYNDFAIVYERLSAELLTALEELSDGIYPEVLFGELIRNCSYSVNGDGERYKVIRCAKNNKGYRCQIEITQAVGLREYIRAYPVHYDEILLMGFNENDLFGRTTDVRELKYLDCEDNQGSDYAVCIEHNVPDPCKSALAADNINDVIKRCNFTKETPPVGIILPHGGVLIQGNDISIKNGDASISQKPPVAIYSPEIITVKVDEEDYIFPPAIQIEKLTIVESKLTKADISNLIKAYEWENFWDNVETDDYVYQEEGVHDEVDDHERVPLAPLGQIVFSYVLFHEEHRHWDLKSGPREQCQVDAIPHSTRHTVWQEQGAAFFKFPVRNSALGAICPCKQLLTDSRCDGVDVVDPLGFPGRPQS